MGRPRRCRGLRSFLPSPYGPISCSQLGSLPRPRPINAPGGAQLGGGEGKDVPPPPAFVPRAPGPPSSPRSPRPAGTRRCGAGCGPSEEVTSRRGGRCPRAFLLRTRCGLAPRVTPTPQPQPLPQSLPAATRIPRRLRPGRGGGAAPGRGRGGAEPGAGLAKAVGEGLEAAPSSEQPRARPPTINFSLFLAIRRASTLCTEVKSVDSGVRFESHLPHFPARFRLRRVA